MSMAVTIRRLVLPAALLALLTGAASAQELGVSNSSGGMPMPSLSLGGGAPRKLTPEEQERQNQIDNAYKAATNKIPDKKPSNDPWGDVRASAPAPKKKPQ